MSSGSVLNVTGASSSSTALAFFAGGNVSGSTITVNAFGTFKNNQSTGSSGVNGTGIPGGTTLNISSGSTITVTPGGTFQTVGTNFVNANVTNSAINIGFNTSASVGTLSIAGPFVLGSASTLDLAGTLSGSGLMNVSSGAVLTFENTGVISSPTFILGQFNVAKAPATATAPFLRSIGSTLNVSSGGKVTVASPAATASRVELAVASNAGLIVDPAGVIDLNNNDLRVPSGAAAGLSKVWALVQEGYSGGTWQGLGITSSAAANDPSHLTALGVIQNNQSGAAVFSTTTGALSFDKLTTATSDVLVKYTYYGDANLSGQVDGSDYTLIDNGYNNHLTGWLNGDFNYDGVIDGSDFTLIDNAFNAQGAQIAANVATTTATYATQFSEGNTAVPEPATMSLLATGAAMLLGRRRRRA